jgi:hypothetical protein
MAKSTEDNQELEQVPSGPTQLDSEEVPQKVTKGAVREYYSHNAVNYEQVAEHFNIELATVVEVIEDGRPLNA